MHDGGDSNGERALTWRLLWQQTGDIVGDRTRARWMCETAAAVGSDEFLTILDEAATTRMVSHLDSMVERLAAGEPLQYVLGSWAFRRLDLAVDARVLIPRPETELVVEAALALASAMGPVRTVVDMGAGSGAIGLALADELPLEGTTVWMTDNSEDALDVARANLAGLGRSAQNVRVAAGSWTDALPADVRADVIVSNPPYVAEGSADLEDIVGAWEPAGALFAGPDGLDDIRVIVASAAERLRPGGALVLEIGADQGAAVRELLVGAGYEDVEVRADLAGHDRIAIGRRPTVMFEVSNRDGAMLAVRHLRNEIDDYARLLHWSRDNAGFGWPAGRERAVDLADVLAACGLGGELAAGGAILAMVELDGDPVGLLRLPASATSADAPSPDVVIGDRSLREADLAGDIVRIVAQHLLDGRGDSAEPDGDLGENRPFLR